MKKVAILISGGGSNMAALLKDMKDDHPCRPALVLSNAPDAGGLALAADAGVATSVIDHRLFQGDRLAFEAEVQRKLAERSVDLICLAGFMRILTPGFVRGWSDRILNIHPSLLPKYPGLRTHARAIEAGDAEAGCTVHEVTPELDAGPILGQARVPVLPEDTPETLAARVLRVEHQLYPATLRRFALGDKSPLYLPAPDETPIKAPRSSG